MKKELRLEVRICVTREGIAICLHGKSDRCRFIHNRRRPLPEEKGSGDRPALRIDTAKPPQPESVGSRQYCRYSCNLNPNFVQPKVRTDKNIAAMPNHIIPPFKKTRTIQKKKRKECASLITHTLQHSRTGSSIERSRETVCQLILLKRRLKNSKYRKGRYS